MAADSDGYLFIETDYARQTELSISLTKPPPNWDAVLYQKPTIHTLNISGSYNTCNDDDQCDDNGEIILQLAFALKSYRGVITTIAFNCCRVEELGHVSVVTAKPHDQLLTLNFNDCHIEFLATKTICYMLESDLIEELSFGECSFDERSGTVLKAALCNNRSLREFVCQNHDRTRRHYLFEDVQCLINLNPNIVRLGLCMTDIDSYWSLYRAIGDNKTLRSLTIAGSEIELHSAEAIMMMCFTMKSLKALTFDLCNFTEAALEFLSKTLSNNPVIDFLNILNEDPFESWSVRCGNLQVQKLCIQPLNFTPDAFSRMIDDIANNSYIKTLNLTNGAICRVEACQKFCDVVIQQNLGPRDLEIEIAVSDFADMLTEAMQHNSSIRSLTVRHLGDVGFVSYCRGLANMGSLRKLQLDLNDVILTEDFFQALQQSLEHNSTLQRLSICGADVPEELAKRYLPSIRYSLAINRVGRNSLLAARIPVGIWPHILTRSSKEADGIYFVLTRKPEIVIPTRKRKERSDV